MQNILGIIVCAQCDHVHNVETDNDFFILNPVEDPPSSEEAKVWRSWNPPRYTSPAPELSFCSTRCVIEFISQEKNFNRVAWLEKDRLPEEPSEVANAKMLHEASQAQGKESHLNEKPIFWRPLFIAQLRWERYREGRFSCTYSNHISKHAWESYRKEHGIPEGIACCMPFPQVSGPCLYISMSGQEQPGHSDMEFCSVAHAIAWCKQHPYDAKGYWKTNGLRCAECGSIQRTDLFCGEGLMLEAVLNGTGKKERRFCSPMCTLQHINRGAIEIATCSYEEHVRDGWEDCCHSCRRTDTTARFIIIVGPYCSTFDDEIDGHFCSMECFMKALLAEEAHFKKRNLGRWYARHAHPLLSVA